MKKIRKKFILGGMVGSVALLSGCASPYNNSFDCPYGQGLGCTSMSTVNKIIDTQRLDMQADLMGQGIGHGTGEGSDKGKRVFVYFGDDKPSKLVRISSEGN